MADALPLADKTVVVSRPENQADAISLRLSELGAHVIKFPLIAIEPVDDWSAQLDLEQFDYLIFTSRNAVDYFFSGLDTNRVKTFASPTRTQIIAAVGKQTVSALATYGITTDIVPSDTFNSEALLAQSQLLKVKSAKIAIIRGQRGRGLLYETLLSRGAEVEYIDVYRRVCPAQDLSVIDAYLVENRVDVIMITSAEALQNLYNLGGNQQWLANTSLLIGSQRIADSFDLRKHQGDVIVADDPSDDQMIGALLNWANVA